MAKRTKLKLSAILAYLQLCRSENCSTLPQNRVPAGHRLSPVNLPAPPSSKPVQIPAPPWHVSSSSKTVSVGCGCRSGSRAQFLFSSCREIGARSPENKPTYSKTRFESVLSSGEFDSCRSEKKKKKRIKELRGSSTFSGVSSNDWFGDDEESGEIKTLVSFSTESSLEFRSTKIDQQSTDIHDTQSPENEVSGEFIGAAVRITAAEGEKVRDSLAVTKKSKDPYREFRRSMMEMIVEKEMYEAEELEQLLRCFLSLNSRSYHGVIVEAFSEIWEILFCEHHPIPPT